MVGDPAIETLCGCCLQPPGRQPAGAQPRFPVRRRPNDFRGREVLWWWLRSRRPQLTLRPKSQAAAAPLLAVCGAHSGKSVETWNLALAWCPCKLNLPPFPPTAVDLGKVNKKTPKGLRLDGKAFLPLPYPVVRYSTTCLHIADGRPANPRIHLSAAREGRRH